MSGPASSDEPADPRLALQQQAEAMARELMRTIELGPGQGTVVPKGVMHRPRAPERTVILMVETAGIVPTGD